MLAATMGSLRKYLMNGAIISAVLGGISALRRQRGQAADWRTYLTWAAWALSLIVALGTVRMDSQELASTGDKKLDKKAAKAAKKTGPAKGPKPVKDPR